MLKLWIMNRFIGIKFASFSTQHHQNERKLWSNSKLFQILNVLAIERGFIVQYEPKMSGIPSKPGTSDFRYIIVYPMVKRHHREDKS